MRFQVTFLHFGKEDKDFFVSPDIGRLVQKDVRDPELLGLLAREEVV